MERQFRDGQAGRLEDPVRIDPRQSPVGLRKLQFTIDIINFHWKDFFPLPIGHWNWELSIVNEFEEGHCRVLLGAWNEDAGCLPPNLHYTVV